MIEDFKRRQTSPSKKRRISNINKVLRLSIWLCLITSSTMVLICALGYLSNSDMFRVKGITIEGLKRVEADEALVLIDLEEGDNILAWDMAAARTRLVAHPWILRVGIKRSLIPAAVCITVEEHIPAATLILKDTSYLISHEGEIFAPAPGKPEGILIRATDWSVNDTGDELEGLLHRGIAAVHLIEDHQLDAMDLTIESGGRMHIRLKGGITLEFLGDLTPARVERALLALTRFSPESGTVMDLSCEDKIVLKNRSTHGL